MITLIALCALLLSAAACGPAPSPSALAVATATSTPTASATPLPTQTPTFTPSPTVTLTPSPTDSPTATLVPTATPLPTPLPATPEPSATATATPTPSERATPPFGIAVDGSAAFVARTQQALGFLNGCAPTHLVTVQRYIRSIQQSTRSGMEVGTGVFMASDVTAFAPGYSAAAQVFWYAGSIVHDARHRWQSQQGTPTNWNTSLEQRQAIEQDARAVQIEALQLCRAQVPQAARAEADYMLKYLTDMQSGLRPCDYCEVEWQNRNW